MFNTAERLSAFGYKEIVREVTHMKVEGCKFAFRKRACIPTKETRL